MNDKFTIRRTAGTDYDVEKPDGTVMFSTTFESKPNIPSDLAADLVTYANNNGQSGIADVLELVLSGIRYIDAR